jgi:hypothetical protein
MMAIPPSEARSLSWWEYQALLWNWNDRHVQEDKEDPAEAPDAAFVARRMQRLADRGLAQMLN